MCCFKHLENLSLSHAHFYGRTYILRKCILEWLSMKFAKNIFKPKLEEQCPGHPGLIELLKPMIYVDKTLYPNAKIWTHMYELPPLRKEQLPAIKSEFQVHDADEIHMVFGREGAGKQRWTLENETYEVGTPSTVYIPAGVKHRNEWLEILEPLFVVVVILKGARTML